MRESLYQKDSDIFRVFDFPLARVTKNTVFTFPFPGSGSLLWIFPSEYSSTNSKQDDFANRVNRALLTVRR